MPVASSGPAALVLVIVIEGTIISKNISRMKMRNEKKKSPSGPRDVNVSWDFFFVGFSRHGLPVVPSVAGCCVFQCCAGLVVIRRLLGHRVGHGSSVLCF
jgi:hypothetical protein